MDIQFYGANCVSLMHKSTRIVVDDNLSDLGKRGVIKSEDVALFTSTLPKKTPKKPKLTFDCPGEYEVADVSIIGIPARAHTDEKQVHSATMYKITTNDVSVLITGHIYPEFSEKQLESIGMVDVVIIPIGGNGYTLDPVGALTIIKEIEPKVIIPTHYSEDDLNYPVPQLQLPEALRGLAMDSPEPVAKLKLKPSELSDTAKLVVLESN